MTEGLFRASPEVVTDITGTGSAQAMSHWEMHQQEHEMPDWAWAVGPTGWHPEQGRPWLATGNRQCDSYNTQCYCPACQFRVIGRPCECPRHKQAE